MIIVGSHAIIKPVMKIISWNINALRAHEMVFLLMAHPNQNGRTKKNNIYRKNRHSFRIDHFLAIVMTNIQKILPKNTF